MKVIDFITLVNSLDCEEFSDVPEKEVSLLMSGYEEVWSIDDTYSTAMNVYECEDGYVGVRGVSHLDYKWFDDHPDELSSLPHCTACELVLKQMPRFVCVG